MDAKLICGNSFTTDDLSFLGTITGEFRNKDRGAILRGSVKPADRQTTNHPLASTPDRYRMIVRQKFVTRKQLIFFSGYGAISYIFHFFQKPFEPFGDTLGLNEQRQAH